MSASSSAPGVQHQRSAAYLDSLAQAAGHLDRAMPLAAYCKGLLLPGERKSVEPMAARLAPDDVQRMHQSLHHFVANAPWSDEALLERVRHFVLPVMKRNGSVVAWIVDDTGFVKKGAHSVGVARQYCGQVGKQENCRVAVSLSVATEQASLPIAWRLYLPEIWATDRKRRKYTGIPEEISFATKPTIALQQIRKAVEEEVTRAPVLADAAYGNDSQFRVVLGDVQLLDEHWYVTSAGLLRLAERRHCSGIRVQQVQEFCGPAAGRGYSRRRFTKSLFPRASFATEMRISERVPSSPWG